MAASKPLSAEALAAIRHWYEETRAELGRIQQPEQRRLAAVAVQTYVFETVPELLDEIARLRTLRGEEQCTGCRWEQDAAHYRDEQVAQRALIEQLARRDPWHPDAGAYHGFRCHHCGAWSPFGNHDHHNRSCVWVQAWALVAQWQTVAADASTRDETTEGEVAHD